MAVSRTAHARDVITSTSGGVEQFVLALAVSVTSLDDEDDDSVVEDSAARGNAGRR